MREEEETKEMERSKGWARGDRKEKIKRVEDESFQFLKVQMRLVNNGGNDGVS